MNIKRRTIEQIPAALSPLPAFMQRIYAARGVTTLDDIDLSMTGLLPFDNLLHIDLACARLVEAITQQQRILILGDFDADGATSSALAVSALKMFGALHVDFLVPNRFEFGYGLSVGIVEVAKRWSPDLIVTVDNGIANLDGVKAARSYGIDVIITDHHLPADTIPDANAIVNPNQKGCPFESKAIAGVGVIFYVMLALRQALKQNAWFHSERPVPNMAQFLDLVALGTVADVVPLDKNNRILVACGLKRMQHGMLRPGILALFQVAKKNPKYVKASDLGFSIAPRLNAAGRLDDMSFGIECLLAQNHETADFHAKALDELNLARREIETDMQAQALQALDTYLNAHHQSLEVMPKALCLMDETWHQGVIGILAGRLKERFHRPVIAFAKVSESELKGSARSISGINIRDILALIDAQYPTLIHKFGGHAMAAGLSIDPNQFSLFQSTFACMISDALGTRTLEGEIWSDGSLPFEAITMETAQILKANGPWGQQFSEPVFDDWFHVLHHKRIGDKHVKLVLKHVDGGSTLPAIAFNIQPAQLEHVLSQDMYHFAYQLDINLYQNMQNLQLLILNL